MLAVTIGAIGYIGIMADHQAAVTFVNLLGVLMTIAAVDFRQLVGVRDIVDTLMAIHAGKAGVGGAIVHREINI